jgi:hypothetical protein
MTDQVSRIRLQNEWVLCAIAAAASRFVPLPLADDLIKTRATRTAVARTWAAHGRADCPSAVGILADDSTTLWGDLTRSAARLPLRLALHPVRKVARVVTAVRGVSVDLVGVVLLARSVDRCLAAGWFTGSDARELEAQARMVRLAHDQVIGTADLRVLNAAVTAVLHQIGGLRPQAQAFARRVFGRTDGQGPTAVDTPAPTADEAQVEQGARQVAAVFDQPEVAEILSGLDRRFDAALATLGPRPGGSAA